MGICERSMLISLLKNLALTTKDGGNSGACGDGMDRVPDGRMMLREGKTESRKI